MAWHDVLLGRWTHEIVHVIRNFYADHEQSRLPSGSVMMNTGVHQRAQIVDFMLPELETAVESPTVSRLHQLRIGIHVAIGIAAGRGRDPADVTIQLTIKLRIRMAE